MIVSLPMYDWPELQSANDALWEKMHDRLKACGVIAPQGLTRNIDDEKNWLSPDLIFGQTCGYPLATRLKGKVQFLATPHYDVQGCSKSYYSSAIVAHRQSGYSREKMRGTRFAYTSTMSWSGYRTMMLECGSLEEYFGTLVASGGHRQSAQIIAGGSADIAAIDAVCWHFLQRYEPGTAENLKVIGWTKPQPALPFITSNLTPPATVDKLRFALSDVLNAVRDSEIGKTLVLKGCEVLDPAVYLPLGEVR